MSAIREEARKENASEEYVADRVLTYALFRYFGGPPWDGTEDTSLGMPRGMDPDAGPRHRVAWRMRDRVKDMVRLFASIANVSQDVVVDHALACYFSDPDRP